MCAGSNADVGLFHGEMILAPWRCVCADSLKSLYWTHCRMCVGSIVFVTCWLHGYWHHARVCVFLVVGWVLAPWWGVSQSSSMMACILVGCFMVGTSWPCGELYPSVFWFQIDGCADFMAFMHHPPPLLLAGGSLDLQYVFSIKFGGTVN